MRMNMDYLAFPQVFQITSGNRPVEHTTPGSAKKARSSVVCKYHYLKGGCTRKGCWYEHPDKPNVGLNAAIDQNFTSQKLRQLPTRAHVGLVLVNFKGERLDTYMRPPTKVQWAKYEARYKTHKICNAFHLQGKCGYDLCGYDHSPVNDDTIYCLRYVLKGVTCQRGSSCRLSNCLAGHICQRETCANGKAKTCKVRRTLHEIDHKPAKWVSSVDKAADNAVDEKTHTKSNETYGSEIFRKTMQDEGCVDFDPALCSDASEDNDYKFHRLTASDSWLQRLNGSSSSVAATYRDSISCNNDVDDLSGRAIGATEACANEKGHRITDNPMWDMSAPLIDL